ncbi:MAG TPA: NAD-dependent epimerase/dehydratase family protein [Stellaceae bacterium]|nr:NAD-dependent epimerase/dehydratase family protein [Stellaceae bacterium]
MPTDGVALITGGAGFIGTNLADRLLSQGRPVRIYDSLARHGTERNLRWLRARHGARLQSVWADIRDPHTLRQAMADVTMVFHFAAQVAVTTSLDEPADDFSVNAAGTLNLLEILRQHGGAGLVFTSTNKVYGALADIPLRVEPTRYAPMDGAAASGISETRPLSFHSPYGCSKGAADQYVLDYARSFGLDAAVFRMSCIYGPHQHGTEDQGWVAHFLIRAIEDGPIAIFGDGRQVRDLLYVEDLVAALLRAEECRRAIRGEAFNIGGGPGNTLSLIELIDEIAGLRGTRPRVRHDEWRVADQRWFVSDCGKFATATGWRPTIGVAEGVTRLYDWLAAERRRPAQLQAAE